MGKNHGKVLYKRLNMLIKYIDRNILSIILIGEMQIQTTVNSSFISPILSIDKEPDNNK